MKISILLLSLIVISASRAHPDQRSGRQRRDVTCAAMGTKGCNISCKARGWAEGSCSWNMDTGAFNCECSKERRGIRCNLGGNNTCYYSCVAQGYSNGMCDESFECNCGGGNNRWGELIENVKNRM